MTTHVGATLRLLRLQSGLGLRDLARRLGVSTTYLSRVENGIDAAPTAARIGDMARELGVPTGLLLELSRRVTPFLADYVAEVPEAASLFLDVARRRLDERQLRELRAILEERFPERPARTPTPRLSDLLTPERIILGLRCATLDDALDIAAGRLARVVKHESAGLAAALKQREAEASSAIGGRIAVPTLRVDGASAAAALVTFARPLSCATPDGDGLRVLVVLLGPIEGPHVGTTLASVARLSTRGLVETVLEATTPARAIARLALLER